MKQSAVTRQDLITSFIKKYDIDMPLLTKENAENAIQELKRNLSNARSIPLRDTVALLDKCAHLWLNHEFSAKHVKMLSAITNQGQELVRTELDSIMKALLRENIEKLVRCELGNPDVLDKWISAEYGSVRREPRGIVFHNISGNAFIVPPVSIAMGLLSKNCNLVKVSKDEPYFAYAFAKSLYSIDPAVEKRLSVNYFDSSESEIYDTIIKGCDCVLHWGGVESERFISSLCSKYRVKLVSHGAKISFEVIDELPSNPAQITDGVAADMIAWEQKACLSPRVLFINSKLDVDGFAQSLSKSLNTLTKSFPKEYSTAWNSMKSIQDRQLCIEKYGLASGVKIYSSYNADYSVLQINRMPEKEDVDRCFYRFIFVCPYHDSHEVEDWVRVNIQPYLQTMGYSGTNKEFLDNMAAMGVTAITKPGKMSLHEPGTSHDGYSNLTELTYAVSNQK